MGAKGRRTSGTAIQFEKETCRWSIVGVVQQSAERRRMIGVLAEAWKVNFSTWVASPAHARVLFATRANGSRCT